MRNSSSPRCGSGTISSRDFPPGAGAGSCGTRTLRPDRAGASPGLKVYARLCGWTLARAHARSGDRVALAAYLGGSAKFDQAIAGFAETYADQNERDYTALQAAVKDGRAESTTEI